ncbi:mRNA-binding ribosome synthesis protein nop7, partial [Coemansia sp. RSA 1694]
FREHKVFLRKLQRALGKDDLTRAKGLEARRPEYTLDHLVIERYPTFVDALRDLDDALCMVFLFATMPAVGQVNNEVVEDCKRLSTEFMHYVIHSHSLRKVFLSIKGIYYQAEIQGQSITWIVPYQFSQNVPLDVDFKVMSTFLQFYRTLLGFVNYRLYTTSNLSYPPKVDQSMDDSAAGLGSLRIEARRVEDLIKGVQSTDAASAPEVAMSKQMKQRMDTLGSKIKKIVASADTATSSAPAYEAVGSGEADMDDEARQSGSLLFAKQVFFLSREVPRYSLEFVVRAFGGRLGWDQTSGGGSPYAENDRAITVQISDRPVQGHQFLDRIYVQPQWVYDSINARRLLEVDDYLIGQPLPAHLSPFVEYAEGDYVPEAASKLAAAAGFEGEVTNLKPEDRDQNEDEDEDADDAADIDGASADEDAPDSDDDEEDEDAIAEKQHQKQLLAERAGVSFSEYQQKQGAKPKPSAAAGKKRSKAEIEEEERQKIAISMLSKKKRKVVNRTQADANKKAKDVSTLQTRKAQAAVKASNGKKKN